MSVPASPLQSEHQQRVEDGDEGDRNDEAEDEGVVAVDDDRTRARTVALARVNCTAAHSKLTDTG